MKVILLQDIKSLGKKGEVKDVSEGYARNFLFAKKLAAVATAGAVKDVEVKKEKEKQERERELQMMRELKIKLDGKNIVIKAKEKKGKLFGSIGVKDIAKKLKEDGFEIAEKMIRISSPMKKVGEYGLKIELAEKIEAKIGVTILGEEK